MDRILKFILELPSIYEKVHFYKQLVDRDFLITRSIPIIYHTTKVERLMEIFKRIRLDHDKLDYGFGILYLKMNEIHIVKNIVEELEEKIYFEFSYPIEFGAINSNFNSCVLDLNILENLEGEGIVIAFLDTGIDYTLDAFRNEDGTTRIKYLHNPNTGKTYNSEEINLALMEDNPFLVIGENDFKGHGTAVASIACAGGNIDKKLYGVAPKSEIISVNITTNIDSTSTLFHTIMKGIDFLKQKQDEEDLKLVLNLSFSSNFGDHRGRSLLSEYVGTFAKRDNVTVVVAAGNEGGAAHHKSGIIGDKEEKVRIEISGDHKLIPISFYKGILTEVLITISSPTTGSSQMVTLTEGTQIIKIGKNSVLILSTGPTTYNIMGDTQIILISDRSEYIEKGIWTISIKRLNEYESQYNMWLPITESIGKNTVFLDPDNNGTLGSPATVYNVISVGSYNYRTETVSIFSGRGLLDNIHCNLKPDLLAPGEEIQAIFPGGRVSTVSGTSFAAPVVSGICVLLMEWGIVKGNKRNLYGEVIKYFLLKGAKRLNNIKYPNNAYGYGFVCGLNALSAIQDSLDNVLNKLSEDMRDEDKENFRSINIFDLQDFNVNVCTKDMFNDLQRAEFIGYVNKNIGNIIPGICVYPLENETDSEFIAIISVPLDKLDLFEQIHKTDENLVIEQSYYYMLCSQSVSPIAEAGIYQVQSNEYLDLTGQDVIVGIIDTGIDYLNEEFIDEIGESRILEIWDQTIPSEEPNDVLFGSIYTKEQITDAINLHKNGGDPYSIVPSRDTNGHGTAMAGITSAKGYGLIKGGAPNSDIVVVKMREISAELREYLDFNLDNGPVFDEVSLYLAVNYLKQLKFKYNKPMVVLIPVQTNGGDHCGNTILEDQITKYSENIGFVVVAPAGNQANEQIHATGTFGDINKSGLIEMFVDKGQRRIRVDLYLENVGRASIRIVSPSGENTHNFSIRFGTAYNFKFLFEGTILELIYRIDSNPMKLIQHVELLFKDLKPGIWQIIISSEGDDKDKKFDAYLPLKELLRPETKFLNSSSSHTVTAPSTAKLAVSIGYYNQDFTSIVAESGQGYTLDNRTCPLLVAGGINMLTIGKGGIESLMSGSSVAAAVAVGGIALLLEWGIVKKNKVGLNTYGVIWLLVSAANTPKGYEYPNQYWGYGTLNIRNVFEVLRY